MNTRLIETSALLVLFGVMTPLASYAGFFGEHPHYLHALSDMKYARNRIRSQFVNRDLITIITERWYRDI
jgi:hypothetical protein